jgi:hypothetical protein
VDPRVFVVGDFEAAGNQARREKADLLLAP